ncbi:hypothetical protein ACFLQI_01705 [Candidatus Undinarchaeota archaeon]
MKKWLLAYTYRCLECSIISRPYYQTVHGKNKDNAMLNLSKVSKDLCDGAENLSFYCPKCKKNTNHAIAIRPKDALEVE